MIHELKTKKPYFEAVVSGEKLFEIRKNDRWFAVGDFLALNEIDQNGEYTGRSTLAFVDYALFDTDFVKDGFCVLSIKPAIVIKKKGTFDQRSMTYDYSFQEIGRELE